jgi:hypothetical protein
MMGNRGTTNGREADAFSHKSRRLLHWRPGELKQLKRAFSKRMRRMSEPRLTEKPE